MMFIRLIKIYFIVDDNCWSDKPELYISYYSWDYYGGMH